MNDMIKGKPTELWEPERLKPYEKNAKKHPPEQLRKLANSIKEHGWRGKPIEIKPDGEIINGHGRWQAALLLEMPIVPVTVIDDMTEEEIRKYRLDDNKTAESEWDTNLLTEELMWLDNAGVDLLGTFDARDLEFALEDLGEINMEAITENIEDQMAVQSEATRASIEDEDKGEYSLSRVLGFSKVSGTEQRSLKRLLAHAETVTDKIGAEALCAFADQVTDNEDYLTVPKL